MRATRPTLMDRQMAFLSTFALLRDEVTVPGGVQHPQIMSALIDAAAALVVGADLRGPGIAPVALDDEEDEG